MWPSVVFNLCVGLLLAWYLWRTVRRFERRMDALIARIDVADKAEQRAFARARDEIRAAMRARIDAAIAEMCASCAAASAPVVAAAASGPPALSTSDRLPVAPAEGS